MSHAGRASALGSLHGEGGRRPVGRSSVSARESVLKIRQGAALDSVVQEAGPLCAGDM